MAEIVRLGESQEYINLYRNFYRLDCARNWSIHVGDREPLGKMHSYHSPGVERIEEARSIQTNG